MSKKEHAAQPDENPADVNSDPNAQWEEALEHRRRLRERQRQRRLGRLPSDRHPQGGREPAGI